MVFDDTHEGVDYVFKVVIWIVGPPAVAGEKHQPCEKGQLIRW